MELFTTIAFTVGLFVLVATCVTAVLMIKTDVFTGPRATKVTPAARATNATPAAPMAKVAFDKAPRGLVS